MLGLILPDRDEVGVVDQDVGCHQHRVGEQAAIDIVGVLGALVLELSHAGQLAKLGIAGQHPGQLGVRGHMALHKKHMVFRVDAHGQQQGGQLAGAAAQLGRDLTHSQAVQVCHHIQAFIIRLQKGPVAHCADIIAQRGRAGGLDAREDAFAFFFCHSYISLTNRTASA